MADSLLDLESYDLLDIPFDAAASLEFKAEHSRSIIRETGGVLEAYFHTADMPLRVPMTFTCLDREEVYNLLTLIHSVKGRLEAFWLAFPVRTVEPVQTFSTDSLLVNNTGLLELMPTGDRLYIKLNDGDRITRKITNVSAGLSPEDPLTLTLNSSVGRSITVAEIMECSRLLFGRFDTDDFEINWITASMAQVTTEFLELTDEIPS